jgi:hypothetical protein
LKSSSIHLNGNVNKHLKKKIPNEFIIHKSKLQDGWMDGLISKEIAFGLFDCEFIGWID